VRFLTATWDRLLVTAFVAAIILHFASWMAAGPRSQRALDPRCATVDGEASIGIALLIPNAAEAVEARIDDALFRLRRARKHCRIGRIDLAAQDYRWLRSAYPLPATPQVHAIAASPGQALCSDNHC
jgi:hypothetical protein